MSQIDSEIIGSIEARSDIGISRKRNEDSILYMDIDVHMKGKDKTRLTVMLVCDGMGGLNAGNWASSYCCNRIETLILAQEYDTLNELIHIIESEIYIMNNDIIKQNRLATKKMGGKVRAGTTFTLLLIHDGVAHLRHLGDSRLYEIIPGGKISVLSQDQSEVMRKVRAGEMTIEEMERSTKKNYLYMCMGIFPSSKLEIFSLDFQVHPQASYLIGTDGFWHSMRDSDFQALALGGVHLENLIDYMKNEVKESDNISALIYRPQSA